MRSESERPQAWGCQFKDEIKPRAEQRHTGQSLHAEGDSPTSLASAAVPELKWPYPHTPTPSKTSDQDPSLQRIKAVPEKRLTNIITLQQGSQTSKT